jgi:hypothetical protein
LEDEREREVEEENNRRGEVDRAVQFVTDNEEFFYENIDII